MLKYVVSICDKSITVEAADACGAIDFAVGQCNGEIEEVQVCLIDAETSGRTWARATSQDQSGATVGIFAKAARTAAHNKAA